jgi:two-component system OmpR family sensor kinase
MADEGRPGTDGADAVRAALEAAGISALVCDAAGSVRGATVEAQQHLGAVALVRSEGQLLSELAARSTDHRSVEALERSLAAGGARVALEGGPTVRVERHALNGGLRVWLLRPEPSSDPAVRTEILGIAAHDLRSPLANIRSYAGMVLGGKGPPLDPRVLRAVQVIARNSDRGLHLVDDLVDLRRSEEAELLMETEPTSMGEILRLAFEEARTAAADRGVLLEWQVPDVLPRLQADPDRMRRALRALLETGIRRTPPGGHVRLAGEVRGGEIYLAVEDEGAPIDVREAALAFDRDHQILAARKLVAGVSMALARVVARAHGGRVGCVPNVGRGAIHFLALPT